MSRILFILITFFFPWNNIFCQDEVTRFDMLVNPWILNPAKTGLYGNSLNFYGSRQWLGFDGAPSTFGFHINGRAAPFEFYTNRMMVNKSSYKSRGRIGLGASLMSDINGPFNYTELKLSYAYHIEFLKSRLSFGLANDFELSGIHENKMYPLIPNDPGILGVYRNKILFNPGIGVEYSINSFDLGFAVNNLFKNSATIKDDDIQYFENHQIYSINGSYTFIPKGIIDISPMINISTHEFDDLYYDISTSITMKEDYKICLTYRSVKLFILHARIDLRRLYIIYGFSNPVSSLTKYIYGSHEITVGYKFGQYVY